MGRSGLGTNRPCTSSTCVWVHVYYGCEGELLIFTYCAVQLVLAQYATPCTSTS